MLIWHRVPFLFHSVSRNHRCLTSLPDLLLCWYFFYILPAFRCLTKWSLWSFSYFLFSPNIYVDGRICPLNITLIKYRSLIKLRSCRSNRTYALEMLSLSDWGVLAIGFSSAGQRPIQTLAELRACKFVMIFNYCLVWRISDWHVLERFPLILLAGTIRLLPLFLIALFQVRWPWRLGDLSHDLLLWLACRVLVCGVSGTREFDFFFFSFFSHWTWMWGLFMVLLQFLL